MFLLRKAGATAEHNHAHSWLWVPAFAGTTRGDTSLHHKNKKARSCDRALDCLKKARVAYAASSATAASSPSASASPSASTSVSALAPRRGLLASWPSTSLTASVSVTCCTTAISRDRRSSAAS